jgi:hypothetical protein
MASNICWRGKSLLELNYQFEAFDVILITYRSIVRATNNRAVSNFWSRSAWISF